MRRSTDVDYLQVVLHKSRIHIVHALTTCVQGEVLIHYHVALHLVASLMDTMLDIV